MSSNRWARSCNRRPPKSGHQGCSRQAAASHRSSQSTSHNIPSVAIKSDEAVDPVQKIIDELADYRGDDGINTRSEGARTIVKRLVGATGDEEVIWETFEQSNVVRARWLFDREVRRRHQGALGVAATSDSKFDAVIGLGSKAHAHIVSTAERVVDAYLANVFLVQRKHNPFPVGPLLMRPDAAAKFKNAVHGSYDGLNTLEATFARSLTRLRALARNVPRQDSASRSLARTTSTLIRTSSSGVARVSSQSIRRRPPPA